jgi:hypothetical protein
MCAELSGAEKGAALSAAAAPMPAVCAQAAPTPGSTPLDIIIIAISISISISGGALAGALCGCGRAGRGRRRGGAGAGERGAEGPDGGEGGKGRVGAWDMMEEDMMDRHNGWMDMMDRHDGGKGRVGAWDKGDRSQRTARPVEGLTAAAAAPQRGPGLPKSNALCRVACGADSGVKGAALRPAHALAVPSLRTPTCPPRPRTTPRCRPCWRSQPSRASAWPQTRDSRSRRRRRRKSKCKRKCKRKCNISSSNCWQLSQRAVQEPAVRPR